MAETFNKIGGALGFAGDVIGLAGILRDTVFPGPSPEDLNAFRIHVGQVATNDTKGDSRSTGGSAPALAGWDVSGGFMSQDTPDGVNAPKIEIGGFRDYAIEGRQEIDYISVVRTGNDGICIHLITGTSANAGRRFAWNGDLGKACGAPWYPQQNPVTVAGSDGTEFRPACVWIDGNGDSGHEFKGFNIHLGSFGGDLSGDTNNATAQAWQTNRDLLCKSEPRFSLYEDIEIGMQNSVFKTSPTNFKIGSTEYNDAVLNKDNWARGDLPEPGKLPQRQSGRTLIPSFICTEDECPATGGSFEMDLGIQDFTRRNIRVRSDKRGSLQRRDRMIATLKRRQAIHADRLVISQIAEHSAVELCNSLASLGPDLVSIAEGMFCDMSEKRLWPLCTANSTPYCFDLESQTVRGPAAPPAVKGALTASNNDAIMPPDIAVPAEGHDEEDALRSLIPIKAYVDISTWMP